MAHSKPVQVTGSGQFTIIHAMSDKWEVVTWFWYANDGIVMETLTAGGVAAADVG